MSFSTNNRSTIDSEVYKWVAQQLKKKKVVTPNAIRQKALEIGQEFDPNFKASINWYNNWKKRFDYNESPEAEALKRKKRSYTASFKLHAVQRTMELESASQASLELDVSRRCLQRWKEELDIISSVAEHSSNAVYRRPGQGRKVRDMSLDTQLLDWVKECWKQGISLSSGMIREKARELSPRVSGHGVSALGKRTLETVPGAAGEDPGESSRVESTSEFKASLGWFIKWQKRHCVDLKEQTCSPTAGEVTTPLKLRLLPEGEVSAYSTPKKRRVSKKRVLSYDDTALLENDEEFDRLLLTWLVERWEAGDIVNDKMLKERALELTANPDFKASKVWLQAWKAKYNVSLENQTYGTDGDEENEEIIEEMQVYDEQVVVEGEPQPAGEGSSEIPVTPTKEEAATALASLSADDHEIAEALQKLANAFGIAQSGGSAKEAVSQLAALQQNDNPAFLLESTGQVAVEEVISEEVVTDEPMVVIEGTSVAVSAPSTSATALAETAVEDISSSTVQSIVDVVSAATQIAQSITGSSNPSVTQPVAESLIQAVANQLSHSSTQSHASDLAMQLQQDEGGTGVETLAMAPTQSPTQQTPSTSLSVTTTDVVPTVQAGTSAPDQFVSEEVIISEPVETSVASGGPTGTIFETTVSEGVIGGQVEVLVQGVGGEVVMPEDHSDTIVQLSSEKTEERVEISTISMPPASSANQMISEIVITTPSGAVPPAHMISTTPAEIQVVSTGEPDSEIITSAGTEIITTTGSDILAAGGTASVEVSLSQEITIPQGAHDILDVVQETVMGEGEEKVMGEGEGKEEREYDRDFKARVMRRAAELGSVQQAAREFSIPWKVVASWNTQE